MSWYKEFQETEKDFMKLKEASKNFTTKEEYLKFRSEWKEQYKSLSTFIRETKASRKHYIYKYRPKGETMIKRLTIIGNNPNYNENASWMLPSYRNLATKYLDILKEAKILASQQRQERLKEAA